jgi:hypothetical protein
VGLTDRRAQFADLVAFTARLKASSTISLMILACGRCCERLMEFSYSALDDKVTTDSAVLESDIENSLLF